MTLRGLTTENNVFLAPLAGVTDLTFRQLCRECGCGLVYTEMISAKGLTYHNQNTQDLLATIPEERPVGVQLFGREPAVLAEAARMIEHLPFDFIDVNMGCPVSKIYGNGEGVALMREPELVGDIVRALCRATAKPVTVKVRKGADAAGADAVEIAKIVEDAGGAAVAVHGRFRAQYYSGTADWDIIARVKQSVSIPVIGNGDVTSPEKARDMLRQTGCDAVMVGRAALGNPWIFKRILHFMETGQMLAPPGNAEKAAMALRHARLLTQRKGERVGAREMRKHLAWYTKGMPGSARIRQAVNQAATLAELECICAQVAELP